MTKREKAMLGEIVQALEKAETMSGEQLRAQVTALVILLRMWMK